MDNKDINSTLLELQKNLEDLSSAREQVNFFKNESLKINNSISELQVSYKNHLKDLKSNYQESVDLVNSDFINRVKNIKSDYDNRLTDLKNNLSDFLTEHSKEYKTTIAEISSKSTDSIRNGLKMFEDVSKKIESTNDKKINTVNQLLEHYKDVVKASNSLIKTLEKIDFQSKLDALSSKSQLINQSIQSSKQEIQTSLDSNFGELSSKTQAINQSMHSFKVETQSNLDSNKDEVSREIVASKDLIINDFNILSKSINEKINKLREDLNSKINENQIEQLKEFKNSHDKTHSFLSTTFKNFKNEFDSQNKEIKLLKTLLFVALALIITGVLLNLFL